MIRRIERLLVTCFQFFSPEQNKNCNFGKEQKISNGEIQHFASLQEAP